MNDSRVVLPESARLEISNGDWLLVRKRLNAGQNKQMVKRGSIQMDDGLRMDSIEAGTAKILAYLLDWSIKDPAGAVIPIRERDATAIESAIDSISPESYSEILRAIEAHERAMQAERTAEKNVPDGEKGSSAPSPSPSDAAGATSGSTS